MIDLPILKAPLSERRPILIGGAEVVSTRLRDSRLSLPGVLREANWLQEVMVPSLGLKWYLFMARIIIRVQPLLSAGW